MVLRGDAPAALTFGGGTCGRAVPPSWGCMGPPEASSSSRWLSGPGRTDVAWEAGPGFVAGSLCADRAAFRRDCSVSRPLDAADLDRAPFMLDSSVLTRLDAAGTDRAPFL